MQMGHKAVKHVEEGENRNKGKPHKRVNWRGVGRFAASWFVVAIIMFVLVILLTIVKGSTNIIVDAISSIDTMNIMFSLVLSAFLEQASNKERDSGFLYDATLTSEGVLTLVGAVIFMCYSLLKDIAPSNQLLQMSFVINLIYIGFSILIVFLGFISRSFYQKE